MTTPGFRYKEGSRSAKVECIVCGRTGFDVNGGGWMKKCIKGHPVSCDQCGRPFTDNGALSRHVLRSKDHQPPEQTSLF